MGSDVSPFDHLASEYDAWFDGEGKTIFATEVRAFQEVLHMLPKPWLEIGVGSGRFAQALGIEVGIDPSARLLAMAEERGVKVYQAKGEEQFFSEVTFGTVFLILTLCFVTSPLAVLREVHRILKPDGKVVLGTVLRENPWGQLYQAQKQAGHPFYQYANFHSFPETVKLLENGGFTIEKVISTLMQKPGQVTAIELPRNDFSAEAGFIVLVASRTGLKASV